MSGQKHDDLCMKRRMTERYMFVCTCGFSDVQVADQEALVDQIRAEMTEDDQD